MWKPLKYALMATGAAALCLTIMIGVSAILFAEDTQPYPITTFETPGKKVLVFAPGEGGRNFVTSSDVNEGQVLVRNRRIALKRDGSVTVDGEKLDLVGFTLLEVTVHPDARVETRVLKATS